MSDQTPQHSELLPPDKSQSRSYSQWPPRWMLLSLGLLLLFLSIGYWRGLTQEGQQTAAELQADNTYELSETRPPVPQFNIVDGANKAMSIAALKGKVVLLSFWASWCAPCVTELPFFTQLKDKYGTNGLEIIAVNVDSSREEANAFIKDFWPLKKINFETFFDPEKKAIQAMSVEILPSNFVIDRKGQIAMTGLGLSDWDSPEVIASIENLLTETIEP